MFAGDGQLHW